MSFAKLRWASVGLRTYLQLLKKFDQVTGRRIFVRRAHGACAMASENSVWAVVPAKTSHAEEAVEALRSSNIIAVPTDTIYGFACDACSALAVKKIYDVKGRCETRPLAICVADVDDIFQYATTENLPPGLLESLLPGPVTLVLSRGCRSRLDQSLNPGLSSIGVRIPDSEFIRTVCRQFGGAVALTSANLSTQPSTVCVQEFEPLWSHCAIVFDAGRLPAGRAGSTIVDLTIPGSFKILREGTASSETRQLLISYNLSESHI